MLSKWLCEKDYKSHFGVAQILLGIGTLAVLISSSKILDILFSESTWLHFTKGLFCGLSFTLLVSSIILSIKGLTYLKQKQ